MTVSENPPTSPIASEQPSIRSGRFCTIQSAPLAPPASSSAVNTSRIGRRGARPARARARTTLSSIASKSFMSTAPRPQMQSSTTSAANGGTDQSSAFGRYDIEVAVDQQRTQVGVDALRLPVRHQRGAAGLGLDQLGGDADLVEQRRDVLGGHPLPRARIGSVVGGVDPDQLAAEVDDLGVTQPGVGRRYRRGRLDSSSHHRRPGRGRRQWLGDDGDETVLGGLGRRRRGVRGARSSSAPRWPWPPRTRPPGSGSAPSVLSLFAVVQLITYAGMQIPVGVLVDRFGSRIMIAGGAAVMAAGQVALALVDTAAGRDRGPHPGRRRATR